jgi:hypothetical protein
VSTKFLIGCFRLNRIHPAAPNPSTEIFPRTHHLIATGKGLDGTFSGWKETLASAPAASPNASSSLQRQPGTVAATSTTAGPGSSSSGAGMIFVRGRGNHMPFRPGGLDDVTAQPPSEVEAETADLALAAIAEAPQDKKTWSKIVPGMKRGLNISTASSSIDGIQTTSSADMILQEVLGDARSHADTHRRNKAEPLAQSHNAGQVGLSTSVSFEMWHGSDSVLMLIIFRPDQCLEG